MFGSFFLNFIALRTLCVAPLPPKSKINVFFTPQVPSGPLRSKIFLKNVDFSLWQYSFSISKLHHQFRIIFKIHILFHIYSYSFVCLFPNYKIQSIVYFFICFWDSNTPKQHFTELFLDYLKFWPN